MTAFTTSDCFRGVFIKPSAISTSYTFYACKAFDANGECSNYANFVDSVTFVPPFLYYNTCSSLLLTNYAPVFILMFVFGTVYPPIKDLLLLIFVPPQSSIASATADESVSPSSSAADLEQQNCSNVISNNNLVESSSLYGNLRKRLLNPLLWSKEEIAQELDKLSKNSRGEIDVPIIPLIHPDNRISIIFGQLVVIFTFGMVCPLLGMIGVICVTSNTLYLHILITRFLRSMTSYPEGGGVGGEKEKEKSAYNADTTTCNGYAQQQLMEASLLALEDIGSTVIDSPIYVSRWLIQFLQSCFVSLFLFDMLSDQISYLNGLWVFLASLSVPIVVEITVVVWRYFRYATCASSSSQLSIWMSYLMPSLFALDGGGVSSTSIIVGERASSSSRRSISRSISDHYNGTWGGQGGVEDGGGDLQASLHPEEEVERTRHSEIEMRLSAYAMKLSNSSQNLITGFENSQENSSFSASSREEALSSYSMGTNPLHDTRSSVIDN